MNKRKILLQMLKLSMYLGLSIIVGAFLLIIVYTIPTDLMYDNLCDSIEIFSTEGMHRHLIYGYYFTDLDNSTDSIMLNIATYASEESPIHLAMNNPRLTYDDMNNVQALAQSVYGGENAHITNYSRYWHGYLVLLKPLLLMFSYQEIRIINMIVQFILLIFVLNLLSEKVGKKYMYAFSIAVLTLNPGALALSLQYSDIYYISLLSMAVLLMYNEWLKEGRDRYLMLFLLSGISTAFFDFLTYPIVTLGFLLVTYLLLNNCTLKKNIYEIAFFSCSWLYGYIGMWAGKWIMASIFTSDNVLRDAFDNILFRLNGDVGGESVSWSEVIAVNIDVIINKPIFILCVVSFIMLMLYALLKKCHLRFDYKLLIPLSCICLYPFFWYSTVKNHSINHYPYAYRNLAILVYSGLSMILNSIGFSQSES